MELKERLIQLRTKRNLPKPRLAEAIGVSAQTISDWESGTAQPTKAQLKALAKFYGIPLQHLAQEAPAEEPVRETSKSKAVLMWVGFGLWAAAMAGILIYFVVQELMA